MQDHVYRLIEIVGTSTDSIEDAVETAIASAESQLSNLRWFEIRNVRGHIEDGVVGHYQVALRIGFTLDDGLEAEDEEDEEDEDEDEEDEDEEDEDEEDEDEDEKP